MMIKDLNRFLITFARFTGFKGVLALGLSIVVSLTEGVSILMLIPMMKYSGILDASPGESVQTSHIVASVEKLGISINLVTVLVLYVAVIFIFSMLQYVQTIMNATLNESFSVHLKKKLFSAFTYADWLFLSKNKPSETVQLLTDISDRAGNTGFQLMNVITTAITLAVHLSISFYISTPLTGLTLISGCCLLLLMIPANIKAHQTGKTVFNLRKEMYAVSLNHISGIKTAKIYNAEPAHLKQFNETAESICGKKLAFQFLNARTAIYYQMSSVILISVFFYVTVNYFAIALDRILLLVFLFARIIPKLSSMNRQYQQIVNALPSLKQLNDYEEGLRARSESLPENEPPALPPLNSGLRLTKISFTYGEHTILDSVSLAILKGQITVLTGVSGAGKSTLADIVSGLVLPLQGRIRWDGIEITPDNIRQLRKCVGYVNQDTYLFNDTIRSNLIWAKPDAGDEDLIDALKRSSSYDFVMALPEKLDTMICDRGIRLSGGQRQRIALARALLAQPDILVMDEATSSLDHENETSIYDSICKLKHSMAILVIAHRGEALNIADRHYALMDGKLIEISKNNRTHLPDICNASGVTG